MRIDPKDLNGKRKETKKHILRAIRKTGIEPKEIFDAIHRGDNEWDICIGTNRFVVEIGKEEIKIN